MRLLIKDENGFPFILTKKNIEIAEHLFLYDNDFQYVIIIPKDKELEIAKCILIDGYYNFYNFAIRYNER